jgi:hypothetical protein
MLIETFSAKAVDLYVLGFALLVNVLAAWFFSNFPQHLWNFMHPLGDRVYTKEDLTEQAVSAYGSFGDLWVCPICLGTWFSVIIAAFVATVGGLEGLIWGRFIFVSTFSWPAGYYFVHKVFSR